ncbi:MAG: hypothetical protein ABSC92_04080 [Rhizomicrobium sp.]
MPVSGIAAAASPPSPPVQQLSPSSGHHRHGDTQGPSISDIDRQSSSGAPGNSTGRIGSVLDIRI